MSYRHDRRESGSRRESREHSSRRSPGPSRRSPSPKPRNEDELPTAFGPLLLSKDDDEKNVLQRMTKAFVNVPLGSLSKCLDGKKKIKVWTRNFKEVRGICTGFVVAFDKHWNLVMTDVDEVYLKPRKSKTPFLDDVRSADSFKELPKKVPKKKKDATTKENEPPSTVELDPPAAAADDSAAATTAAEGKKKKKKRTKKKGPKTERRYVKQMFLRGDNIVMAAILCESDEE